MKFKTLELLRSKLQRISEAPKIVVADLQKKVLQLQRSQLREGKNNKGGLIRPPYSYLYLLKKQELNSYIAPSGTPDLFLTGDFQKSIFVEQEDDLILNIESDRSQAYFDRLLDKYQDILGLNTSSKEVITKAYFEATTERIQKIIRE